MIDKRKFSGKVFSISHFVGSYHKKWVQLLVLYEVVYQVLPVSETSIIPRLTSRLSLELSVTLKVHTSENLDQISESKEVSLDEATRLQGNSVFLDQNSDL